MKVQLQYHQTKSSSPLSPWVHRRPRDEYWVRIPRDELIPPMPPQELGKGYKVWSISHRGHDIFFSSVEEMEHAVSVLGQRVVPRSKDLADGNRNQHWLSRLHKTWKPWKVRQRLVAALEKAIEEEKTKQ